MNKKARYWIYTGIAVVIVILIVVIVNASTRRHNDEQIAAEAARPDTAQQALPYTEELTRGTEQASTARAPLADYLTEQDTIMTAMMENMSVPPSGNASIDFLTGMIPHHESAIEMSQSYLKYGGENADLKLLAENIIDTQTGEIEEMNRLITEIRDSGNTNEEKENGYLKAYEKMMSTHQHMGHGTSAGSDVEEAFAEGMIMHHQMAVDMAKAILDYTDDAEVRKLAEHIVKLQEEEIQKMQAILQQ